MNKNPYIRMIELMREHGAAVNPPSILLGRVIRHHPRLIVELNGIQIDKDNILIASGLSLASGDIVAIMPTADKQTFIILCKVVEIT